MNKAWMIGAAVLACLAICGVAPQKKPRPADDRAEVAKTLDAYHAAAGRADLEAYIGLMAPESVFLGTDDSERWTREEFRKFCEPYFARKQGWTYTVVPERRFVVIAPGGAAAWFDEALDNDNLGRCRGSGVLVKAEDGWKIAQYNLTMAVPNELADDLVKMIRESKVVPAK